MEPCIDISPYAYLWTSEYPNWVLRDVSRDGHSSFLIQNVVTDEVLLVSLPALEQAILEEMLKRGCRVIDIDE